MGLNKLHTVIVENMDEAVYIRDLDMNVLYINPAAERLSGWSLQEALKKKCYEVFGDENLTCKDVCPIEKAISQKVHILHHEGKLKTRSSDVRDMRVSISPLCEGETAFGAVIVMEDISCLREVEQTHVKTLIALEKEVKQRKIVEETLRESENRCHLIAENARDIIWTMDLNARFTYISPAVKQMLGYSVEEALSLKVKEFLTPSSYEYATKVLAEELENEKKDLSKPRTLELEHICKDGSIIWAETLTDFLRNSNGKVVGIVGVTRDITERKQAEEKIKRYQFMVESAHDAIFFKDLQSRYVIANAKTLETFGLSKEKVIGKNDYEIMPNKEEAKKNVEDDQLVFKTGKPTKITKHMTGADGKQYWFQAIKVPQFDDKGNIIGVLGIARDISERKRAEEALRESEEKFRSLAEKSLVGVYLIQDGIFKYVNPMLAEIFGYTVEELLDKKGPKDVVLPEDWPIVEENLQKRISGEIESIHYDFKGITKNRQIIYVEVYGSRTVYQGRPAIIGTLLDITERKRAEEERRKLEAQLQHAQKMEAIGTLAGGIAHDFNNLLMGIEGYASLMLMHTDSSHPHYDKLNSIKKQVQSGVKLTEQLLGYARKGKYEVKPINLNELVQQTSDIFGTTKKEITIHRELAEDLFAIEADQGQIEQVLLNLYVNAADAMPGGGNLIIKTMNTTHDDMKGRVYDPKPGNYVLLIVTDTGIGMDKKTRERIFDPFFTSKEMGRGTGLGLASVYGIIKGHGGYIDVESKKGHGSTFRIYLSASEKKVQKVVKTAHEIIKGTETLLLADDEEAILEVGKELSEALGYRVLTAKDGKEAVEVYKKNQDEIDIVLLDMVMPNMGGSEAYDRMKEINPNVKVLLSSGYSLEGQATKILERGCNGFIQKPFTVSELSKKIGEILKNK